MTEQDMHRFAEQNANEDEIEETVGDLPSDNTCPECSSTLDDDGDCTDPLCPEHPDFEDDIEFEDEDADDS